MKILNDIAIHLKLNWIEKKNEIQIGDEDIKNLLMNMMLKKRKRKLKKKEILIWKDTFSILLYMEWVKWILG